MIPIVNVKEWKNLKEYMYINLIKSLGKPVFEYHGSSLKDEYNYRKKYKRSSF